MHSFFKSLARNAFAVSPLEIKPNLYRNDRRMILSEGLDFPHSNIEKQTQIEVDVPQDFDPEVYRALHSDLHHLSEAEDLARHYIEIGLSEGRFYKNDRIDVSFYRSYYKDLSHLNDSEAVLHYVKYGRIEGRSPNTEELLADLQRVHGALPADFLPSRYRAYNPDTSDKREDWELQDHYLRFGRKEGRVYIRHEMGYYDRAFEDLRKKNPQIMALWSKYDDFTAVLADARMISGTWLDRFMLYEFGILNNSWLPKRPTHRIEGLCLFLTLGLDRLAPIAMGQDFDPAFYRAREPANYEGQNNSDLYREWLCYGHDQGLPANEGQALVKLLGVPRFPECFDEPLYRADALARGDQLGSRRFDALQHFVAEGFIQAGPGVLHGPKSEWLLARIADYHLIRGDAAAALRSSEQAVSVALNCESLQHRRGDALRMVNRFAEATEAYAAACEWADAGVWSHIHAAEGLIEAGKTGPALNRLLRSAKAQCGFPAWRSAAHRTIEKAFSQYSGQASDLYRRGLRSKADLYLTECLDRLKVVIEAIDPLPAPLPPLQNGRIVLVANRDLPQCDHYRVTQKVQQLVHGGWKVDLVDRSEAGHCRPLIDRASAVIFYRVPAYPAILHAILYARALGVPTIYEIDDLVFDSRFYPDPFVSFEGQITQQQYVDLMYGVPLFRYAMQLCDIGLASTPALAEAVQPLVRSGVCHVLRNGFDTRNDYFLELQRRSSPHRTLTIFYGSGTNAHNSDFTQLAAPALLEMLMRYPEVRLVIAGYLKLDPRFLPFTDRVIQLGFTKNIEAYWDVLSGCDINLAVLSTNNMTDAKSEIKWLEAAMLGIPSIVSATRTYREILVAGETALLADTVEDWTYALDRLISDTELREAIGYRAHQRACAGYSLNHAVSVLSQFLPLPLKASDVACQNSSIPIKIIDRKPRLLIVNVYFPPHLIGGATRVMRDNVDYILDNAGNSIDIAIAAIDDGVDTPYETRIDNYRGVPVYRIAPLLEENMDWRPFNSKMRAPFEDLLDRFQPDLIHFHCVQRFTATIVECVKERDLPYVVTLHDAWWISNFQFLIDDDGQVQTPTSDPYVDTMVRHIDPIVGIARRRRLHDILSGARALLAVSAPFAEIYRAAGYPNTTVVENGVSAIEPFSRMLNRSGKIRLGHIGGRTSHKGATLIEAVLRENKYENLTLTLVDHARVYGEVVEETWGTTPVRLIGRMPQDRVRELYAEIDVLLAPSIWPESYGLVTREAQAAGLWVVASDQGAIGGDLIEDVDGFVIDVSSTSELAKVLKNIDTNPVRFCQSPPVQEQPMRTSDDQGSELLSLYRSILVEASA